MEEARILPNSPASAKTDTYVPTVQPRSVKEIEYEYDKYYSLLFDDPPPASGAEFLTVINGLLNGQTSSQTIKHIKESLETSNKLYYFVIKTPNGIKETEPTARADDFSGWVILFPHSSLPGALHAGIWTRIWHKIGDSNHPLQLCTAGVCVPPEKDSEIQFTFKAPSLMLNDYDCLP